MGSSVGIYGFFACYEKLSCCVSYTAELQIEIFHRSADLSTGKTDFVTISLVLIHKDPELTSRIQSFVRTYYV